VGEKKEYIERGALIRLFDERYITAIVQQKHDDVPEDHKKHWKGVQSGTNWCRNTVLEAPAADVVEVVRCKDCVKFVPYTADDKADGLTVEGTHGVCFWRLFNNGDKKFCAVNNNEFCSYGERKEQNNGK
jgi:hypothetical protein